MAAARAVYDASVERYLEFVGTEISAATEGTIDRALLDAFVELIGTDPGAPVADVGCGPGRVASFLVSRGVRAVGIDASPAMVAAARAAHPGIAFEVGRLDALPLGTASVAGAVCWYSIIHTPADRLADAYAELRRVLEPNGCLLLGFQSGGETLHRDDAHGTGLPLTSYRHELEDVTRGLGQAGFYVHATAERSPELAHETTPQAFVIARRSSD
ncbi:MAG: class I SAM-dependent methyltransferase [Actinobacteria bacterium]|nr:class I SAM-dependent methyltransferase [Actinomycetota bacterium]MBV9665364.1 class I SAM-dependent methyltransferase [Actinomycetota bacterium]MBV9933570.1 class I SAM-dependent methyltransferase [Actinomycetota bacterium]